jgi:DNA-binding GntR family transcriptional regulator
MYGKVDAVARDNLTARVYENLRNALMEGRFGPGHRFKIRELAAAMDVSETPVREAVMQLVREKGLEMRASRSITVAELTYGQYTELREIRLHLEGMAGAAATSRISNRTIRELHRIHHRLVDAENAGRWSEAVSANWHFHHTIYQAAEKTELLAIIEGIWLRNGPLVNYQYPHARPTYEGEHQHLHVLRGLEARDPETVRKALQDDLLEGGANLVKLLAGIEAGTVARPDVESYQDENGQRPASRK